MKKKSWVEKLDDVFDIAPANVLQLIKIEEDKQFLISQRKHGRPGFMYGIDHKTAEGEFRAEQRRQQISNQRERSIREKATIGMKTL